MRKSQHLLLAVGLFGAASIFTGCDSSTSSEPPTIGFFGSEQDNVLAQGVFAGIQEAAKAAGATATFVDGNFDGQQQVAQVRDAIASKEFDVIVINANDNLALQAPLQEAADAGITVVVEFTPVGPDLGIIEPQVDGAISMVNLPGPNGKSLAELAQDACATVEATPCKVAYLEGFKSLELDTVRTAAFKAELATDAAIELVASVEGGYTPESGRAAFEAVLAADPDVHVVVGSSQAISGAAEVAGGDSDILFIGNGSSRADVEAVRSGAWFATFLIDPVACGKKAVELGLAHARGEDAERAVDEVTLVPNAGKGTRDAIEAAGFEGTY